MRFRAGIAGYLVAAAPVLMPSGATGQQPASAVSKFSIESSPIGLRGDVRPHQYLGVVGRAAAWLGLETGEAELWVHPLKLASDFQLSFVIPDYMEPVRASAVARTVDVRPELTTITYSHATFTVRQHILAPLDEKGLLVLVGDKDVIMEQIEPLELPTPVELTAEGEAQ